LTSRHDDGQQQTTQSHNALDVDHNSHVSSASAISNVCERPPLKLLLIWFSRASAFSALRDGLLSVNGAAGNFCEGQESFLRRLMPTYDPVTPYSLPSTNVSFINVSVSPQISALTLCDDAQNAHLPSLPRSNAVFVDDFY